MRKHFLSFVFILSFSIVSFSQQTASEYFEAGVNKSKAGDFIGALTSFSTAIAMNPDNHQSYFNRGLAKQALKDNRGAI